MDIHDEAGADLVIVAKILCVKDASTSNFVVVHPELVQDVFGPSPTSFRQAKQASSKHKSMPKAIPTR